MVLTSSFERQHLNKMPQHTLSTHIRKRILPGKQHQIQAYSPFTYAYHSIANERHPLRNEDRILVDELTGLVAVFDGVGGSAAGEIASQAASYATLHTWMHLLQQQSSQPDALVSLSRCDQLDLSSILNDLILEADDSVRNDGAARAGTDDLATTVALAALCHDPETHHYKLIFGHVGDSRIYLLREQEPLQRLTSDDGLLAVLVEKQLINDHEAMRIDQAMNSKQLTDVEYSYFRLRGGITQALGGPVPPTIHISQATIKPGDRILLCTDGIHDNLTDKEIEYILRSTPRSTVARTLVQQSQQRSHQELSTTIRAKPDDMSAVVVTCRF